MVEQANPQRSLVRKLTEVMAEVDRIPKRGHNSFHNYDYVLESDLVDVIRGKLAERHIFLFQSMEEERREGTLTILRMRYTFSDADSGETYEVKWVGQGEDKGDKGAYKAATGALKYLLLKHFLIPTGDDPEADSSENAKNVPRGQANLSGGRREQKGITVKASGENAAEDKLEGRISETPPKSGQQTIHTPKKDSAQMASRNTVSAAYKYGKDALGLSMDELGDLLAEVRNGLKSTEGITTAEVADWRQRMGELAKAKKRSPAMRRVAS